MTETRLPIPRPASLPLPGEPITRDQCVAVMAHYDAAIRAEGRRIYLALAERVNKVRLSGRVLTADDLLRTWGPALDRTHLAYVCYDNIASDVRFRFVDLMVDKASGELVIVDRHAVLALPVRGEGAEWDED